MKIAAIVTAIVAAQFLLAVLIGSFMRVGSNADTRTPEDLDNGAR